MTLEERCIVSAYTGYLMCNIDILHKFIEERMGRPVWTHELASDEIRLYFKEDFLKLCGNE